MDRQRLLYAHLLTMFLQTTIEPDELSRDYLLRKHRIGRQALDEIINMAWNAAHPQRATIEPSESGMAGPRTEPEPDPDDIPLPPSRLTRATIKGLEDKPAEPHSPGRNSNRGSVGGRGDPCACFATLACQRNGRTPNSQKPRL